jgi:hypothetical protein
LYSFYSVLPQLYNSVEFRGIRNMELCRIKIRGIGKSVTLSFPLYIVHPSIYSFLHMQNKTNNVYRELYVNSSNISPFIA